MATTPNAKKPGAKKPVEAKAPAKKRASKKAPANMDEYTRFQMIADAAYYLAEARGFTAGQEFEDWLTAERLIAEILEKNPKK